MPPPESPLKSEEGPRFPVVGCWRVVAVEVVDKVAGLDCRCWAALDTRVVAACSYNPARSALGPDNGNTWCWRLDPSSVFCHGYPGNLLALCCTNCPSAAGNCSPVGSILAY